MGLSPHVQPPMGMLYISRRHPTPQQGPKDSLRESGPPLGPQAAPLAVVAAVCSPDCSCSQVVWWLAGLHPARAQVTGA